MTKKIPAYGARAAKAPVAPMTIERRDGNVVNWMEKVRDDDYRRIVSAREVVGS